MSTAHLLESTIPVLQANHEARIGYICTDRWITHPVADAAHDAMRQLVLRPTSLRPRGLLLTGPYHNGKTMIAERFAVEQLRQSDPQRVWVIQTREGAGLAHFYASILSGFYGPRAPGWKNFPRAGAQIDHLLDSLKPRVLIFDEFHNALHGRRQNVMAIFSYLRRLARVYDISPVLVGEVAVYDAINDTEEMASRFDAIPVPRWRYDDDYLTLLDSLEACIPLPDASNLAGDGLARRIHQLSEGLIGEVTEIIKRAAIAAIKMNATRITPMTLDLIDYLPLSKRRNSDMRE